MSSGGLNVKFPILLADFNQVMTYSTDFHNRPSFKFHGDSFNVNHADTWENKDVHDEIIGIFSLCERSKNVPSSIRA